MAREKVTLTLDSDALAKLRSLVGTRSLSASVNKAIVAYTARLRHFQAVDEWMAELDREHGPVPPQSLEWAARIVDRWQAGRRRRAS